MNTQQLLPLFFIFTILSISTAAPHSPISRSKSILSMNQTVRLGFTGDSCIVEKATYCVPPRICMDLSTTPPDSCSRLSEECICRPPDEADRMCSCDKLCSVAERCVRLPGASKNSSEGHCRSWKLPGPKLDCPTVQTDPGRFSYEACVSDDNCAPARTCVFFIIPGVSIPCEGREGCLCLTEDLDDHLCSCKYLSCLPGEECTTLNADPACSSIALKEPLLQCNLATPTPGAGDRYSFEICLRDSDCAGDRKCNPLGEDITCRDNECKCIPNNLEDDECSCLHPECMKGDECGYFQSQSVCLSVNLETHPLKCRGEIVEAPKRPVGKGKFTNELCRTDQECAGNRTCLDFFRNPCSDKEICNCLPPLQDQNCNCRNTACLNGDVCAFFPKYAKCNSKALDVIPITCKNSVSKTELPSSANQSPTPDAEGDTDSNSEPTPTPANDACVDANALSELHPHELVYKNHIVATVLCDSFGSCATPGHMVHYAGRSMMMKKYCKLVECQERIMEVNSPRYKRGLRVASKSEGLEYTAFAARYGTRAEEVVMATALRMGL